MRVRAVVACLVGLALAGCRHPSAGSGQVAAPSTAALSTAVGVTSVGVTAAPLKTCGSVPVATGSTSGVIGMTVTGPASAVTGSQLTMKVQWRSIDGKPHVFDAQSPVVLIVQGQQSSGSTRAPSPRRSVRST